MATKIVYICDRCKTEGTTSLVPVHMDGQARGEVCAACASQIEFFLLASRLETEAAITATADARNLDAKIAAEIAAQGVLPIGVK